MDPITEFLLMKRGALKKCSGCGKEAEVGADGKCAGCGGKAKVGARTKEDNWDKIKSQYRGMGQYVGEHPLAELGREISAGYSEGAKSTQSARRSGMSKTDVSKVEAVSSAMKQTKGMTVPQRKQVMKRVGAQIPNQKTASLRSMIRSFTKELVQIEKRAYTVPGALIGAGLGGGAGAVGGGLLGGGTAAMVAPEGQRGEAFWRGAGRGALAGGVVGGVSGASLGGAIGRAGGMADEAVELVMRDPSTPHATRKAIADAMALDARFAREAPGINAAGQLGMAGLAGGVPIAGTLAGATAPIDTGEKVSALRRCVMKMAAESRPMTATEEWGPSIYLGKDVPLDPEERKQRYLSGTRFLMPLQAGGGALGGAMIGHGLGMGPLGSAGVGLATGLGTAGLGQLLRHQMAQRLYEQAQAEQNRG